MTKVGSIFVMNIHYISSTDVGDANQISEAHRKHTHIHFYSERWNHKIKPMSVYIIYNYQMKSIDRIRFNYHYIYYQSCIYLYISNINHKTKSF